MFLSYYGAVSDLALRQPPKDQLVQAQLDKCLLKCIAVTEIEWADPVLIGCVDDQAVRDFAHGLVAAVPRKWFYVGGAMDVTRLGKIK